MKTFRKILFAALLIAIAASAQEPLMSLSFEDAPIEQAVELYREWTGRTIIKQADLSARITLKGRQLTQDEAKQAIETVLAMNNIALVPMGEKFLKVVPIANARQEGMEIKPFDPEKKYTESDTLITQVIPLRYVVFADVQPLIQHLVHGYGKIIEMARINSVLITDTSANIARIIELISMVDQPAEKIKPRIYQLKYAEAATIAGKLKELVEAAKTKKSEQTVVENVRTIPGVIRAQRAAAAETVATAEEASVEMIEGDVKIVSDERTNIIIVFSKAANFSFFDNIIKVLDVPVDPAVVVETVNLEYAKAKDIAGILNDFVGAAKATEKSKATGTGTAEGSKTVDEIIRRAVPADREISDAAKNAIGRLSADTKILPDERSNSLLLMGRKSDIAALKQVIASLDVMLSQVLLEVVILDIQLGDSASSGINWLYSNLKETSTNSWGVGFSPSGLVGDTVVPTNVLDNAFAAVAKFPKINVQAVIQLSKSTSNAKLISTPVILTTDNTEAKITSGRQIPVERTSFGTSSSVSSTSIEYKDVDLSLTITPQINPQNFVVMEIDYSASEIVGDLKDVTKDTPPTISKRTMTASIGVDDKSTAVLGGLVSSRKSDTASKIPLLGDIPLLGRLFQSRGKSDDRSEIVVLVTPYVLTSKEDADRVTKRIYNATEGKNTEWPRGWSQSPLANDEPEKDDWKKKKSKKDKAEENPEVEDESAEPLPVATPAE